MDFIPILISLVALSLVGALGYRAWKNRDEDDRIDRKARRLTQLEKSVKRTAEEMKDV